MIGGKDQELEKLMAEYHELKAENERLEARVVEQQRELDVDALSNFIRSIDGNNTMGAGELAERIAEWVQK